MDIEYFKKKANRSRIVGNLRSQIKKMISEYNNSSFDSDYDHNRKYKPLIEYNEKAQEVIDKKQDNRIEK